MRRSAIILLVLAVAVGLGQTRILLYEFEPRGVDQSITRMVDQLLEDAINGTYKYIVVDPPVETHCYNVVAAAESAAVHGAAKAVIGNIMSLGGKQFLTYQLVDAATSAIDIADKVELPPTDEFPVMADRIAASVVGRVPYGETAGPRRVTATEVAPRLRHPRKPYASVFLTGGYQYHFQRRKHAAPDTNFFSNSLVNLNLAVTFETQQLLTMLQMGLLRGKHDETDISFDLLGNYVIGKGDFAPLIGGGVGITRFGWTDVDGERRNNDGLNLSAGVGMLALRTYYFRLIAAGYLNYTIASNDWGSVPGAKIIFGVTTPTLGPDATIKMHPGRVGAAIGGFFLTGLVIALVS